jgi:hypothetical protein
MKSQLQVCARARACTYVRCVGLSSVCTDINQEGNLSCSVRACVYLGLANVCTDISQESDDVGHLTYDCDVA